MPLRNAAVAIVSALLALASAQAANQPLESSSLTPEVNAGQSIGGFPSWSERVIHEWMNRARVDPQMEMTSCGAACADGACYTPQPPLSWNLQLARAARFHADEMLKQSYFAHDSACTIVSSISSLYPSSCDGSATCACAGGIKVCNPACTLWNNRVALFNGSAAGEIIVGSPDPNSAFYVWLYEQVSSAACQYSSANGHRWLILTSGPSVGVGVSGGNSVGDFGSGTTTDSSKIVSGAHYPRQAASVDAWANWYDTAAPRDANIVVDGTPIPLVLTRGTATNGAWHAVVSGVGTGCHRYYFRFTDPAGAAVRYPTTGTFGIGDAACSEWQSGAAGDFNLDTRADIVLRDSSGSIGLWMMNGSSITSGGSVGSASGYNIAGIGDFNGDGYADILLRDNSGNLGMWLMNGSTIVSGAFVGAPGAYTVAGVADFNGDGKADILLRDSNGSLGMWLMNGPAITSGAFAGSPGNYTVAGVADFNGDGKADILLRDSIGSLGMWLMNGPAMTSGAFVGSPAGYSVAGVADFNGDGKADILLRDASGSMGLWLMNGPATSSGALVGAAPGYSVPATHDYNGDGKADILLRDPAGNVGVWLMNGSTIVSGGSVGSAGLAYTLY